MLSLVIVSYNTCKLLHQCLISVRKHCPQAQVIVVDNSSSDASAEMVRSDFPEALLIVLETNRGFAGGNNAGLPLATGEFVVLLNSDTVLEDDSLQRCTNYLTTHPEVGAASPRLRGIDGRPQQCLYQFPNLRDKIHKAFHQASSDTKGPRWLAGTTLVIRREALQAVDSRLDDTFFMYWEDADFSARLLEAGWTVAACEDACILHYGGASGGGTDALRRADLHAWYTFGEHRWFAKHRPWWESAAYWCLDFADVLRRYTRGLLHRNRRGEWTHANTVAGVLGRRLLGLRPALPGAKSRQKTSTGASS